MRPEPRIPTRWTAALFVFIVAALAGACSSAPGGSAQAQDAAPTVTPIPTAPAAAKPVYTVQRGTVQDTLSFTARWLPRDQQQLSFETNGSVQAVNVRRGDTVTSGELLAQLQITDLQNQLASAQLNLESAIYRLQSGEQGSGQAVTSAQFQLANSRLGLDSTVAGAPWTSLESARQGVIKAQQSLDDAQRNYDNAISHPDASASSVDSAYQNLRNARQGLQDAQLSYASAQQNYAKYQISVEQQQNSVLQNEMALQDAVAGAGADPDLVQAVRSAQLQIDQINASIAQSSLYAPFDGVVLEVTIQPGDSVQAYTTVITLALPEPMEAIANLAFNDTQSLSVGMVGVCSEYNQPDTAVQCAVRQLPLSSRDVDQSVRVAASLGGLPLGQLVQVDMPLQVRENVLWLPPAAIRTYQSRTFVVLQTPDGEQVSDVQLGLQTDDRVEITSGVQEGDLVVGP